MFKYVLIPAVVSLFIGVAAGAQAQTFEPGMNRPGGDYRTVRVSHPRRCQDQCLRDLQCRAWAYETGTQTCRLKGQWSFAVQDSCCVSGIRQ